MMQFFFLVHLGESRLKTVHRLNCAEARNEWKKNEKRNKTGSQEAETETALS